MPTAAQAARAAPRAVQPPSAADQLLDGLALLNTEGYMAAAPTLKRALSAFSSEETSTEQALRWLGLACRTAVRLWDDESWDRLSTRYVALARDAGALSVLPIALNQRAGLHVSEGDFASAASLIEEAGPITEATGSGLPVYTSVALFAYSGREREFSEQIKASMKETVGRQQGAGPVLLDWATAVLNNGLGRHEVARHQILFRARITDALWPDERAAVARDQAHAHVRIADLRVLRGKHHVA